jgi:hypothetical protein
VGGVVSYAAGEELRGGGGELARGGFWACGDVESGEGYIRKWIFAALAIAN